MGWTLFVIGLIGWHIGMYGMFKKAGIEPWKALVPFYNTWCMVQKMELHKGWFFAQFVPIAGQFITIWITIKFVEHFGRFGFWHHAATTALPFVYFPYLGFSDKERYAGIPVVKNYRKSGAREWIDAAFFAIVAATIIRTFIFEAYTIPTPSMEKTLLVNDFLFVSKFSYGPRLPNTPLAIPFVHHTLPVTNTKSYLEWIRLPYKRWFASPVKRNDVVVFNFPVNDTLINDEENFGSKVTYYQEVRNIGREAVWNTYGDIIITRPVDKRENFIKRCVAIAGDVLEVKNGIVFVNGKPQEIFPEAQRYYQATSSNPGTYLDAEQVSSWGIYLRELQGDFLQIQGSKPTWLVNVTNAESKSVRVPAGISFTPYIVDSANPHFSIRQIFPYYNENRTWTVDNYGPITIPAKDSTIQLTLDNYTRYERCIGVYEGNKVEWKNNQAYVNGTVAATYTFKMNYYWMMGDNRHNSLDSRYWGFVPEDHIVGKASMIFFSYEGGPRWKRIFQSIR
jgi:signal peptidase I